MLGASMRKVSQYKLSSLLAIMAVFVIVIVCLLLASWQWQRAENKKLLLDQEGVFLARENVNLETVFTDSVEMIHSARFKVLGSFLTGKVWFLDNKVIEGRPGYDLIALFQANHLNKLLLVNLGFIPAPTLRTLPSVRLPEAEIELDLQIKSKDIKGFTLAPRPAMNAKLHNLLQYLDISYFSTITGLAIYPFITYQLDNTVQVAKPHYKAVVMSPQKHQAYALQWLLIGVSALVIGGLLFKRKEL
jgi:cytochrome oxidase assembly protein ShyY1